MLLPLLLNLGMFGGASTSTTSGGYKWGAPYIRRLEGRKKKLKKKVEEIQQDVVEVQQKIEVTQAKVFKPSVNVSVANLISTLNALQAHQTALQAMLNDYTRQLEEAEEAEVMAIYLAYRMLQ